MEGSYGKEPFDLRLTVLRMIRNLDKIFVFTLVGTILFGGGYYVKNVLLRGEILYSATSTYKIEYADEDWAQYGTYINGTTWNTHVHTEEFLRMVQKHLPDPELAESTEELGSMLQADLPSDLRVLATTVTSSQPGKCVQVAEAVQKALVEDFPAVTAEVSSIRVTDPASAAEEVASDARPLRAFILSAVLSFFFTIVILLLKETGDDCIWLPATIRKRYGLPVLGTIKTKELAANTVYLFRGMKKIAVCAATSDVNPVEVADKMAEAAGGTPGSSEWIPVPSPYLTPEVCGKLRQMDGILLAVRAGSHAGKPLEYVLEYLEQQDCKVTAAILWDADELLIKSYYCFH